MERAVLTEGKVFLRGVVSIELENLETDTISRREVRDTQMLPPGAENVGAHLADVAQEIRISEAIVGEESGYENHHRVVFPAPKTADYRASIYDIAEGLRTLMKDSELRRRFGEAGRQRVQKLFDYRVVARQFLDIIQRRLGID